MTPRGKLKTATFMFWDGLPAILGHIEGPTRAIDEEISAFCFQYRRT